MVSKTSEKGRRLPWKRTLNLLVHSDDITDVLWRKFVAPSGQAGKPRGEGDAQNSCRVHCGCPQGVWTPVVPGEGLHND